MSADLSSSLQRPEHEFTVELITALHLGSGDPESGSDAGVVRDFNGLPALPGPGIQGMIRTACLEHRACGDTAKDREAFVKRVFGYTGQKRADGTDDPGRGGRAWIGWGSVHTQANKPQRDWLTEAVRAADPVLADAAQGCKRDHVKLSKRGTAHDTAKFDEIVINPGHRFTFAIRFSTASGDARAKTNTNDWQTLLTVLHDPALRLGAKTRRGLGKFKFITAEGAPAGTSQMPMQRYQLNLTPATLWMFGRGQPMPGVTTAEKESDSLPVWCQRIEWTGGTGKPEKVWIIPGTGIKGPLVHRTRFHANLAAGNFIDEPMQGDIQPWLTQLFGDVTGNTGAIGSVIIDDHFLPAAGAGKVQPAAAQMHVKINPFTGGASDTALYCDHPLRSEHATIPVLIEVRGIIRGEPKSEALKAFEAALADLQQGHLALGAHAGRGYGCFTAPTLQVLA